MPRDGSFSQALSHIIMSEANRSASSSSASEDEELYEEALIFSEEIYGVLIPDTLLVSIVLSLTK